MKAIDYKGKHFILQDEADEDGWDIEDPYVDADKVVADDNLLISHVRDCNYYGIPPYLGKNKELHERIKKINESLNPND